jgi:Holliday junction resolvase RusA-like endonuclease
MTMKNKKVVFYQNQFYDDVFICFDKVIPSKRIRYKQNEQKIITDIITPSGTQEFENYIKKHLTSKSNWPYKGRLLIAIFVTMKESDYRHKDIDNITKSLLDAMKGKVYEDDIQIDLVHVQKIKGESSGFGVGIKELDNDDNDWYFPRLYGEEEFSEEQTYTLTAKYKVISNS